MIACDIDGTLLDYSAEVNATPIVNNKLISQLVYSGIDSIALVTNQGGLIFGKMGVKRKDGGTYPKPSDFILRFNYLYGALRRNGIGVYAVRVSTFHPRGNRHLIEAVACEVREGLGFLANWHVYTTERSRKPNPHMLKSVGATTYYGDSEEDEKAALAAGVKFVKVERFIG